MSLAGVMVDSDEVFKVAVVTTETESILVKTGIAGETFETFEIKTSIEDSLLVIRTGRALSFEKIDDKLAAHKVMSVEITIEMPKNKELYVDSDLASVAVAGSFERINLNLLQGWVKLKNFSGNGKITTKNGFIAGAISNTQVEAYSNHGQVLIDLQPPFVHFLKIHTVEGDITITPLQ